MIAYKLLKRFFDIFFAFILLIIFLFPMVLISLYIFYFYGRPVIHMSKRIGRDNILFHMPKFRTMKNDVPQLATDKLVNPSLYILPLGRFLRKYSLDELPQLILVLFGKMSFVGPRPALFNQNRLIRLRKKNCIDKLQVGLTGWAQINGRDDISTNKKIFYDLHYLNNRSLLFDLKVIFLTFFKVIFSKNIKH